MVAVGNEFTLYTKAEFLAEQATWYSEDEYKNHVPKTSHVIITDDGIVEDFDMLATLEKWLSR